MAARLATNAEVRSLAAEFADTATFPDALLTVWSVFAARFVGLQAWSDDASDGHAMLVAHYITRSAAGALGPSGPLTAEANGPASRSFAAPPPGPPTEAELRTTFYGQAFLALRGVVLARCGTMIVANSTIVQ
jgi:hypothetical protein